MNNKIPNILIVDDITINVEIIMEFLEEEHYQLSSAEQGGIAWQLLASEPRRFDVILLDLMMPKMNGLELLVHINQHEVLKQCPVILQTSYANREDILEGMKLGAYYYLPKPFDENMLHTVVYAALRERQNFKVLRQALQKNRPPSVLKDFAEFRFQNLKQICSLASLLANLCPNPANIILGLWELMVNAVEHGNLGITYLEKPLFNKRETWIDEIENRLSLAENRNKFATIEYQSSPEYIEFTIRDQGKGFDWNPYLQMNWQRTADSYGRGIAKAGRAGFSSIEYRGSGNEVVATVNYPFVGNFQRYYQQ